MPQSKKCSAQFLAKGFLKVAAVIYVSVVILSVTNKSSRSISSVPDFMFEDSSTFDAGFKNKCMLKWSELGDVPLNLSTSLTLDEVAKENAILESGGFWQPKECEPWQKVAILIPYRDRAYHLRVVLNRLHPMLRKQKLSYQVFVLEQAGKGQFARGRLFNVGFVEVMKMQNFDCIIMQDVDILPETDKNIYACDSHARHISGALDEMRYHPIYSNFFGGVTALSSTNFKKVNGFGNRFVGWGNEDDDLSARTIGAGLMISRPPTYAGRCKMIRHMKSGRSEHGYEYFLQWRYWWKIDGLSNLDQTGAKVISVTKEKLYTNITIDIGWLPDPPAKNIPTESYFWFLWFYDAIPDFLHSE